MGTKLTHIRFEYVGDHTAQGWWFDEGQPKLEELVVVEALKYHDRGTQELIDFFHKMGARQIQILPPPNEGMIIERERGEIRRIIYENRVEEYPHGYPN